MVKKKPILNYSVLCFIVGILAMACMYIDIKTSNHIISIFAQIGMGISLIIGFPAAIFGIVQWSKNLY